VNNYKTSILSIFLFVVSVLMCVNVNAVAIEIHPDEKPHLDALIKRLNIDKDKIEIWARSLDKEKKKYTDYFRKFGDYKYYYLHNNEPYENINFVTNYENKIVYLMVLQSDLVDLREIQHFKNIKWLDVHVTNIKSLRRISKLKKLERLDFNGNKSINSLSEIKNLPSLKLINSGTSTKVSDISGMKNLPKLREFICSYCIIADLTSLSEFIYLEKLKVGTTSKSLKPLKTLKNLRELQVHSQTLTDISAISSLESLEVLNIYDTKATKLDLLTVMPKLKEVNLYKAPLDSLPDLSQWPNIETLFVMDSAIEELIFPKNLSKLRSIKFTNNKKISTISRIGSMPSLEELTISKGVYGNVEIDDLPNLKMLNICNTNITQLGDFSRFPNLEDLRLFYTNITSLNPLFDAPKLSMVILDNSARDVPNFSLITQALGENALRHTDIDASRPSAKERYEQLLAEKKSLKPEKTNRRRRN
jgi:hypothetical protein